MDLVLAGQAPEALLDTYASEPIPHVHFIINYAMEYGKVVCVLDPAVAAARDARMIAAARQGRQTMPPWKPALGPGMLLDGDPYAGQLFVQGRVERGGVTALFDDVVGRGFTLVSVSFDPATHLDADAAHVFSPNHTHDIELPIW